MGDIQYIASPQINMSDTKNPKSTIELDKLKTYPINEAIALLKQTSKTKFDASVEVHIRLGINSKKSDQQIRGGISLPHGTGKIVKVAAFVTEANQEAAKKAGADIVGAEDLIEEIKKTEKTDFAVAVAEPAIMPKLAQIAKILGTRGLMPSPKNETVTPNPTKAIEALKKGKINFKNDSTGNLHIVIGKVSFESTKLEENFKALIEAVQKLKPSSIKGSFVKNIALCSSMSPGIKVQA